jgi:HNH endonuclease
MLSTAKKVLVLNRNWCAIGVVDMQDAIGLVYATYTDGEPKARIVTPPPKGNYEVWDWGDWTSLRPEEGEHGLVSASAIYKVPEVILLSKYEYTPEQKVNFCRRSLWRRDNYSCQYCGRKPKEDECTIDHVVPKSLGGGTSWTNCVLACYRCNSQKADRRPEDAVRSKDKSKKWVGPSPMKLLREPVKPEYSVVKDKVHVLDTWKHWLDKMYWEVSLDD